MKGVGKGMSFGVGTIMGPLNGLICALMGIRAEREHERIKAHLDWRNQRPRHSGDNALRR